MKSRLGVLLVLALFGSLFIGATSPASAARYTARSSVASPIVGQTVRIAGVVPPAQRPVALQVYRSGKWLRAKAVRTTSGGRYAFTVKATSAAQVYRSFAPAIKIKKRKYPLRYSNNVRVAGLTPSLALAIAAAPVGQLASGEALVTPGIASFRPARPGAAVAIQQLVSGSWKTVVSGGRQDSSGQFRFQVRAGSATTPATFRAVTAPGGGAPTVTSPWVKPDYLPLAFEDDFNGDALDPTKWATRTQLPTGRRQCAMPSPDRVGVEDGAAVLSIREVPNPTANDCPNGFYENAMIGTKDAIPGFTATYGMFAARVKFQAGAGQHGSFWLQGPKATGAEIDTAEYFGDGRSDGGLSSFVHYTDAADALHTVGGIQPVSSILGAGRTPSNSWHVYSVEWTRSGYTFRVDGVPTLVTSQPFVATDQEYLVLSLLTSDWELSRLNTASSTMQVDWVRAWSN